MPIYDLFCPSCGAVQDDVILKIDEISPTCDVCDASMARVCNCHSFELKYNNKTDLCGWSNDGYASSQYWNEYKKQKSEGKNVRIKELDGDG